MAVTNIPNITNWSVTPQNGQVGYFTLMNTWLSESTAVLASLQTAINAQNTANSEINDLAIQTENNANIAASVGNYQGVWSNLVTYSKSMGVSVGNLYYISKVDSNLNHAVTDTNYWLYNPINDKLDKDFSVLADKTTPSDSDIFATRETGGLLKKISWANSKATLKTYFDSLYLSLTRDQTIAGVKTFSSNIVGNITGNAGTAAKLATARTINGVAFDGSANITVSDSTAVNLTGNQTIAGVKTFSSNIVGNITGNAGTATTLSTNRSNFRGSTESVVAGELMWKIYGNDHTIFDASDSTSPTGAVVNNTNPDFPWVATYPTLMGYNKRNTYGVRVDSSRYADSATKLQTARTINGVAFDGSANITVSQDFGVGQTWQDVTASRVLGTTYTNSTGKPIMVFVTKDNTNNNTWEFYINGVSIGYINGYGTNNSTSTIIPNGSTYMADTRAGALLKWVELR